MSVSALVDIGRRPSAPVGADPTWEADPTSEADVNSASVFQRYSDAKRM